ncbi:solute carrier family 35 member F2 [Anabrus simplex]|uniref:solute carrier family 35 member F2 n=1 Tax=Anabrus simplex TaxID=316456 RepID=UPI0035A280A5
MHVQRSRSGNATEVEGGIFDKADRYLSELGRWPVWRAIVYGQLMSLLLCAMAVSSYYLNSVHHLVMPTGQSFLHYSLMCMIYTTWLACRSGENGLVSVLRRRGWRYLLIALADVEASTLLITAHQFTTLTSIQLLDCVSIPAALALSCLLLRVRYKIVHIVGVGVCLMGVGCLVWADIEDGRPLAGGKDRLLGDMLCLGGAILFSVITVAEEYTVKTFDWVEYLGMVGLFGSVFNGLQLALLEKQEVSTLKWDSISMISLLVGFGLAQFLFHSIAPTVLKDSGATALQLSLLTADFYSLIVGIILLQYKFHALYFLSFTLTMTGVLLYAIKQTPISSQQTTSYSDVSFPSFEVSGKRASDTVAVGA